jgi:hypothetical protein
LRLRPDAVAMSPALKKIAILEQCRPYDQVDWVRPESLPRPSAPLPEDEEPD